ncbi:hypothetical protein F4808DRAFT_71822 [Astrocystis sublimbata]|nr:hypothetical protein F4808DRAFT_71822 [Astrocystis sublimbata]
MKAVSYFASVLAVAYALPSSSPAKCGPDSNCELVNINGTMSYRFKPDFAPGSSNHRRLFYSHAARQDDNDANLKVYMGKNKMQWGCDVDVLSAVTDSIDENCGESGCDEVAKMEFDVKKWEGDTSKPSDAKLKITTVGKFFDSDTRDFLREALRTTISDDSVEVEDAHWQTIPPPSGQHWGLPGESDDCAIKRFPNYVAINRFDGKNIKDYMEIHVELEKPEENCLATEILETILGAINPLAGDFFSVAQVLCDAEM